MRVTITPSIKVRVIMKVTFIVTTRVTENEYKRYFESEY